MLPPMKSGAASTTYCITTPAMGGPTAQPIVRVRFVTPLAYVR